MALWGRRTHFFPNILTGRYLTSDCLSQNKRIDADHTQLWCGSTSILISSSRAPSNRRIGADHPEKKTRDRSNRRRGAMTFVVHASNLPSPGYPGFWEGPGSGNHRRARLGGGIDGSQWHGWAEGGWRAVSGRPRGSPIVAGVTDRRRPSLQSLLCPVLSSPPDH